MATRFPLFSMHGPVLLLDGEAEPLQRVVQSAVQPHALRTFNAVEQFAAELGRQRAFQRALVARIAGILERWRNENEHLPSAIHALWSAFQFTEIVPLAIIKGFPTREQTMDFLTSHEFMNWGGSKVVLAGKADYSMAIQALNAHLIDWFGDVEDMAESAGGFTATAQDLIWEGNSALDRAWASQVSPEQEACLARASDALRRTIRDAGWIRHAVLGTPFGVLGHTADGRLQWLQLETDESLEELLQLLEDRDAPKALIEEARARRSLASSELDESFLTGSSAFELGDSQHRLLGAFFDFDISHKEGYRR